MKKLLLIGLFLIALSQFVFSAPTYFYATVAGAGTKAGTSFANAFGYAELETAMEALTTETDYYYFIKEGEYTFTSDFVVTGDGSAALPNHVIGVVSATTNEPPILSDWATDDNRPLFSTGVYAFELDDYWRARNIRGEGMDNWVLKGDLGMWFINCKATNSSEIADRAAFWIGGIGTMAFNCEAISTNGKGFYLLQPGNKIHGCYVHDSKVGILANYSNQIIVLNLIDTCSGAGIGITATRDNQYITQNTIYNAVTGIEGNDSENNFIGNNIFDNCTTGINWDAGYQDNYFDYNNYYNNTSNMVNVTTGTSSTFLDPGFTDAPNGDFSIGENLSAKGFPGTFPGGLSVGYLDIGAVQREETGGGGSGSTETSYFIAP